MEFKIDLEKLTEEQLEALRKINNSVVETEIKRRKETTYSPEEIKNNKIYADLYKAYFYIKPMYDNMRNTDVKKTLTQSEILPVLEKVFRYADSHGYIYEKFQGEVVEQEPTPIEKAIEEATPTTVASTVEPTWEPGGGAEIEQPIPVAVPAEVAPAEVAPAEVAPAEVAPAEVAPAEVAPAEVAPIDEIITSPVEKMSTEELNKILANIPTVEKI